MGEYWGTFFAEGLYADDAWYLYKSEGSILIHSLPYTYEARVDMLAGRGSAPFYEHYFSDTICGLVEYLSDNGIRPAEVRLYGVYRKRQIPLEVELCVDRKGTWLTRPNLCHALEEHYRKTMDSRYLGHVAHGTCSYDDRDRRGLGPF